MWAGLVCSEASCGLPLAVFSEAAHGLPVYMSVCQFPLVRAAAILDEGPP